MARNKKNLMSLEKYCVYFKFCHLKKKSLKVFYRIDVQARG